MRINDLQINQSGRKSGKIYENDDESASIARMGNNAGLSRQRCVLSRWQNEDVKNFPT